MRIDALLDTRANPAILAAATVYARNPALDEDTDTPDMGATGRTFPCRKTGRARYISTVNRTGQTTQKGLPQTNGVIDLHAIVQLLNIGENKIKVLNLLRRQDLLKIIRMLPQELLVNALRLFNKEKLIKMMLHLPPKYTLKLVLQLFKIDELVKRMPTSQLMRILKAPQMDNRKLAKGLLTMEPRFLQLLMSRIYGGNKDFTKLKPPEIFKMLVQTDRALINESLKTMPFKALQPLVSQFIKKEPALLCNVSEYFISRLVGSLPKPMLIRACMILPPEILMTMLGQLPNPMLVLAASQIDDNTFENYLVSQQGDLLQMLASGLT